MKTKFVLLALFCFATILGQSQNLKSSLSIQKVDWNENKNVMDYNFLQLNADFMALTVFGQFPLQVEFKDISSGNPTSWQWKFGDGGESNLKHPVYTYQQPGIYTVKLTVSDGTESASITKTSYITVQSEGLCDSVGYPLQGDYVFYKSFSNTGEFLGYLSGNNGFGDLSKASLFSEYNSGGQLVAGIFDFAIAKRLTTNDVGIKFKVWDNDGSYSSPGTVLDSVEIKISEIVQNAFFFQSTVLVFNPPVEVSGPFFLGVELPQIVGDTLVLFTNENGVVPVGNGWEQQNTGDWFSYSDEYSWKIDIDHAIFPVVCGSTGIENHFISDDILIFPNPVTSTINIAFLQQPEKDLEIRLTDLTGRILAFGNILGSQAAIDVSHFGPGTFILSLISSKNVITRKIVVER